ncbi:MAG: hypothetical protein K6L73_14720 [Cellvibrionaceae bacterium]
MVAFIQALLSGVILIGIYKYIDRNREAEDFDPVVDWKMAALFVFSPTVLIWLANIGIAIAQISWGFILIAYTLYFIIPFAMLKFMLEFKQERAVAYAAWVPVIAISTELLIYLPLQSVLNT